MFEKITRRADCANKRRIYKLGLDYLRKNKNNIECLRKLQDAPIAQIRGEFINIVGHLRKNNIECLIKLQDAQIAQNKRRIYKYSGTFAEE